MSPTHFAILRILYTKKSFFFRLLSAGNRDASVQKQTRPSSANKGWCQFHDFLKNHRTIAILIIREAVGDSIQNFRSHYTNQYLPNHLSPNSPHFFTDRQQRPHSVNHTLHWFACVGEDLDSAAPATATNGYGNEGTYTYTGNNCMRVCGCVWRCVYLLE